MEKLQYAKSKEELLNAPLDIQNAMFCFISYNETATELRNDIGERFNYPSLWAAIDRLIDFVAKREKAFNEIRNAGYTIDDAIRHALYEQQENN